MQCFSSIAEGTPSPSIYVDIALVIEPGCNLASYDRMKMQLDITAELE
jgi:hypothetical protein